MIRAPVAANLLQIPKDKYDLICRFIWNDETMTEAPELDDKQAALLVCGSLVYKYAREDIGIILLKGIWDAMELGESFVISVVDELYLSTPGNVWELSSGRHFTSEESPDIVAVESHALDVMKALTILSDVSEEPQSENETFEQRLPGRPVMPPGMRPPQFGAGRPYPGRPPSGMGWRGPR